MPAHKRSRRLRRVARATDQPRRPPSDRQLALRQAAAAREKQLAELRLEYEPKLTRLTEEWAEKRRDVWRGYEERKELIRRAALLQPAAEA